jgi:hypothetical protein
MHHAGMALQLEQELHKSLVLVGRCVNVCLWGEGVWVWVWVCGCVV